MQTMSLLTDAFGPNSPFDPRYTCDLDNSSPELRWENVPPGIAGFALIVEDRDATPQPATHWLIYNIPPHIHHLPAGIPPQESLPNGIKQGINSFGKLGYSGPCPPIGDRPHHYVFRLFALSYLPPLAHRIRREDLMPLIEPYVLTTAEVVGIYQRAVQRAG